MQRKLGQIWMVVVVGLAAGQVHAQDMAASDEPYVRGSFWDRAPAPSADALPTALTTRAQVPGQWQGQAHLGSEAARGGLTPSVSGTLGLGYGLAVTAGAVGQHPTASLLWRPLDGDVVRALVGVRYKGEGFTEPEGEMEGLAAVTFRLPAQLEVHVNAVAGGDPDGNGWDVEGSVAALRRLGTWAQVGLEGRTLHGREKGLTRDHTTLAPSARVDFGRIAVIGSAGVELGSAIPQATFATGSGSSGWGPWGMLRVAIH